MPAILAIESSCDETAAAVVLNGKVLNNVIASQHIHRQYGGVVPELASRAHQKNIVTVTEHALQEAHIRKSELQAIAFTQGPGLLGSLMVGASFAKGMSLALDIPLIAVNHMEAHVMAHFIPERKPAFPFLCLTVSGGHTEIILVKDFLTMEKAGETLDDAAGEAFDKGAKMLGLPYPGGPLIDRYAAQGNPAAFNFPCSQVPALNFSFSGIKTALLYFLKDKEAEFITNNLPDICASLQAHLIKMLMNKLTQAAEQFKIKTIAIAGGVSANSGLRAELQRLGKEKNWEIFIPDFQYCTDNAAMIGIAGHYKFQQQQWAPLSVAPAARMPIPFSPH